MADEDIIKCIARHFGEEIRDVIIIQGIKDPEKLLQYLKRIDDIKPTKRRHYIQYNRWENRNGEGEKYRQHKTRGNWKGNEIRQDGNVYRNYGKDGNRVNGNYDINRKWERKSSPDNGNIEIKHESRTYSNNNVQLGVRRSCKQNDHDDVLADLKKAHKDDLVQSRKDHDDDMAKLKKEQEDVLVLQKRVQALEDFNKWKKVKNWQQSTENLKNKLKERDNEVEKLQQTCSNYRLLIDRLGSEKHNLENKVKSRKISNVNKLKSDHVHLKGQYDEALRKIESLEYQLAISRNEPRKESTRFEECCIVNLVMPVVLMKRKFPNTSWSCYMQNYTEILQEVGNRTRKNAESYKGKINCKTRKRRKIYYGTRKPNWKFRKKIILIQFSNI